MSWAFNATRGLVLVAAEVSGPTRDATLTMALDTGATHTFIRTERLAYLGYEPSQSPNKVRVITGSGEDYTPVLGIDKLSALGREREAFSVTAVQLPASASVDGVIGLDFLRGGLLTLDFHRGLITLV